MAIVQIDSSLCKRSHNVGSFKSDLLKYVVTDTQIFLGRLRGLNPPNIYSVFTLRGLFKIMRLLFIEKDLKVVMVPSRLLDFIFFYLFSKRSTGKLFIVITDNWFNDNIKKNLLLNGIKHGFVSVEVCVVSQGLGSFLKNEHNIESCLVIDMGNPILQIGQQNSADVYRYVGGLEPDRLQSLHELIMSVKGIDSTAKVEIYCPKHELSKVRQYFRDSSLDLLVRNADYEQIPQLLCSAKGLLFVESFRREIINQVKFSLYAALSVLKQTTF